MIARDLRRAPNFVPMSKQGDVAPSGAIEAAYYVSFLYTYMSPALGISIGLLGAAILAGVAALCVRHFKFRLAAFEPIKFPVACAVSFIAVQVLAHDQAILSDSVRSYVSWIFIMIVMQSFVRRPGFLHRFMVLMLLIGLVCLPFLVFRGEGQVVERAAASGGASGLSNANALAAWFGFCAVYFMVLGLESKRDAIRLMSWVLVAGCLLVIGLAVSRGSLLAVVLAGVVVFRRLPKRGLLPISILIFGAVVAFGTGVYRQSVESYNERGAEETGRLLVWPVAAQRFFDNPLTGVGVPNIGSPVPGVDAPISPHNVLLFIGLASGIIPLIFYMAYWLKAASGIIRLDRLKTASAPYYPPMLIFAFVAVMLGENSLATWVVFALAGPLQYSQRKVRHQHGRTEMLQSRVLLRRHRHERRAQWQR